MFRRDRDESWPQAPWEMRLGFDLVQVSQVADSIARFGDTYENRIFTAGERDYARRGEAVRAERLAARLAAKEAVIKALKLSEAGIAWSDIEVFKLPDGDCEVHLHGRTAELADRMGVMHMLLSLSHDGDYAGAVVTALLARQPEGVALT
jgi:holo-[acyl-carrier protein] synthase